MATECCSTHRDVRVPVDATRDGIEEEGGGTGNAVEVDADEDILVFCVCEWQITIELLGVGAVHDSFVRFVSEKHFRS